MYRAILSFLGRQIHFINRYLLQCFTFYIEAPFCFCCFLSILDLNRTLLVLLCLMCLMGINKVLYLSIYLDPKLGNSSVPASVYKKRAKYQIDTNKLYMFV